MGIDETRMQHFDRVDHVESPDYRFIPIAASIHFQKVEEWINHQQL
jgi:hypothetical protein